MAPLAWAAESTRPPTGALVGLVLQANDAGPDGVLPAWGVERMGDLNQTV